MTLFFVKHAPDDYQLHRETGATVTTVSLPAEKKPYNPGPADVVPDILAALSEGAAEYRAVERGDYRFRNVDLHGTEEVPWR